MERQEGIGDTGVALKLSSGNSALRERLEKAARTCITGCFRCGKCSAGCPTAPWMDILPHQMVHRIALGIDDDILSSRSIWLCVACQTCVTRCPNAVDIPGFMEELRRMSQAQAVEPGEKNLPVFISAFLNSIRKHGRVHELGMMRQYKLRRMDLFSDIGLGISMFFKGKLALLAHKVKGVGEIRGYFDKASKGS